MALWYGDWDSDWFGRNPWRELESMRRWMGRLLSEMSDGAFGASFPLVNVRSDDQKAVVTAEVPGVKQEDLDVSVEDGALVIRGSREPEELAEGECYRRRERPYGAFARRVELPFAVDADRIEASYAQGVLTVTLPRSEASKPRKIEIKG
jgi:HSP20 family protein